MWFDGVYQQSANIASPGQREIPRMDSWNTTARDHASLEASSCSLYVSVRPTKTQLIGESDHFFHSSKKDLHFLASKLLPCPLGPQSNITIGAAVNSLERMLSTRNICSSTRSCPITSYRTLVNGRKNDRWMSAEDLFVCGASARSTKYLKETRIQRIALPLNNVHLT